MRSQVVLLPLAMLALLVVMRAVPLGRAARIGIALYLLLACVVAPWTLRNWIVLGTPALVSTNDGANLLLGNHPDTRWGSGYPVTEGKAADLEGVLYSEWRTPTDEAAWDRRVRARALAYVAADPLHYLLLWPRKIRRQFDPDAFAFDVNQEQAASVGQDIGFLRPLLQPLRDLFHETQIGLVLLGLALAVRQRAIRLPILFCVLPAAYFAALSCVFFAEPRFNFPAIPFLIGGAVCALAVLASALFGRLQTAPAPTACS